jgi:hypothetical protein
MYIFGIIAGWVSDLSHPNQGLGLNFDACYMSFLWNRLLYLNINLDSVEGIISVQYYISIVSM